MEYSTEKPIWSWKSNSDPWDSDVPEEWTLYSDIQNEIIEEAYKAGKECVTINDYDIYPKTMVQILKTEADKQRPIKRAIRTKVEEGLRNERFFLPPTKNYSYNRADIYWDPPLVRKWLEKNGYSPTGTDPMPDSIVEVIADGIIKEGSLLGQKSEAEWMAEQLRKAVQKDRETLYRCCVMLYTRESFLYKVINKALREEDLTKSDTIAPFCFFLNQLPTHFIRDKDSKYRYEEVVYRGANLTLEMVKSYQKAKEENAFIAWDAFTSTTKDRNIAEKFGNTLFVIRMAGDWGNGYGCDIEALSVYPHEKEVLLPASAQLTVDRVAKERKENGKYIIYLARRDEGA